VGILRGPSLNPYEGQCFEKLPQYGFQPIGITTYDNTFNLSEIHFPKRVGHNFNTITKGKIRRPMHLARRASGYDFNSWNLLIFDLKKLTADLDIIYSSDEWYPYSYQAVKTGIPTIIMQWENIAFNPKVIPYPKIRKYNHEYARHFVAITEKAKDALVLEGVTPDRISVVPAGLDCEKFRPMERNEQVVKKLGISQASIRILFVGRLVPEKGIFKLLIAFSMLLKKVENVELLIVGSGSPNNLLQIRQLVKNLKISGKVKFLGKIEYSNMPQIHNLADVFCLPSIPTKNWAEQFGYSMVEAMACGKPVISTYSGSIPEIVKDHVTGILVQPEDPHELASAIEELIINERERENLGKNARNWVLREFEANKIAGKLAEIYRRFM
jgi:alpha-maltose-1-phosphate synthase